MERQPPNRSAPAALQAALNAPSTEPGRARALPNALTFVWRALLKIRHTPEQLFDVVVTPIMFTVLFTYLFGGALAGSTREYLHFLLPGILVQTVMFTSVYTGFTLNTDLSKGIYDRFRSMPIWMPSPIVGAMLGDVIRFTVTSLIVVIVGLVMGFRAHPAGILLSIMLLNVFAFGIGWIFTTLALLVRTPATVMTMSWLVLMPLTFASNIFVDPSTMPSWLQAFVVVNPVTHIVTAVREAMAGTVSLTAISASLLVPALITACCGPLAMHLYRRER